MAALEAAIQAYFGSRTLACWMAGSSPAMTKLEIQFIPMRLYSPHLSAFLKQSR